MTVWTDSPSAANRKWSTEKVRTVYDWFDATYGSGWGGGSWGGQGAPTDMQVGWGGFLPPAWSIEAASLAMFPWYDATYGSGWGGGSWGGEGAPTDMQVGWGGFLPPGWSIFEWEEES